MKSDGSDLLVTVGQVRRHRVAKVLESDGSDKSDDFALEIFIWPRKGNFILSSPPLHTFVSLLIVRFFLYSRIKIKYYELHS